MKQLLGVAVLASMVGLAIAATSPAGTERTAISCAAVEAAVRADVAAAQKAATVGDYKTELRVANEVKALAAQAKRCATTNGSGSNAPAKFSESAGLPQATLGKPYPPTTFCPHIVGRPPGQCDDAAGRLITFTTEGNLLPLGMRLNAFNGTLSGTPRVGQSTQPVQLKVCSERLQDPASRHCVDATLKINR